MFSSDERIDLAFEASTRDFGVRVQVVLDTTVSLLLLFSSTSSSSLIEQSVVGG